MSQSSADKKDQSSSMLDDVRNKAFIQRRLEQAARVATSIKAKVKAASPLLSDGVDRLDGLANWAARTPLGSKVVQTAPFFVYTADEGLNTLYAKFEEKVGSDVAYRLVHPEWFKSVDAIVAKAPKPVDFQKFFDAAKAAFDNLKDKQAGDSGKFLSELRTRLHSAWDDSIVGPANVFFQSAVARVSRGKKPDEVYSEVRRTVAEAYDKNFVTRNARSLYAAALDYYTKSDKVQSASDYVQGFRKQLGTAWNDRFATPLEDLYNAVKSRGREDIKKIVDSLQEHLPAEPRELTVGGALDTTTGVVSSIQGVVSRRYADVIHLGSQVVDYVLPEGDAKQESHQRVETVGALVSTVTSRAKKKAFSRVNNGWAKLQQLSSDTVAPALGGVDPLKQAAQSSQLVSSRATALIHGAQARIRGTKDQIVHIIIATLEPINSRIRQPLSELRSSLTSRVTRSRVLSSASYNLSELVHQSKQLWSFSLDHLLHTEVRDIPHATFILIGQLLHLQPSTHEFEQLKQHTLSVLSSFYAVLVLRKPKSAEDAEKDQRREASSEAGESSEDASKPRREEGKANKKAAQSDRVSAEGLSKQEGSSEAETGASQSKAHAAAKHGANGGRKHKAKHAGQADA